MRTHHTQKLDRRPPPPPPASLFPPFRCYCRERFYLCRNVSRNVPISPPTSYIRIYNILYAYTSCPGFTRLRYIHSRARVCMCRGRNSSFFTPSEQYHRRSTRMKNVVNIVRSAAAALQQRGGGFSRFIIFGVRIELGFL